MLSALNLLFDLGARYAEHVRLDEGNQSDRLTNAIM
jgi:hypothetical protein